LRELDALMGQDTGLRCAFTSFGPFFVAPNEFFRTPERWFTKSPASWEHAILEVWDIAKPMGSRAGPGRAQNWSWHDRVINYWICWSILWADSYQKRLSTSWAFYLQDEHFQTGCCPEV